MIEASEPFLGGTWLPAADVGTLYRVDGGQTRVMSGIYPRLAETDTVTIQTGAGLGSSAFRLTDIPVVEED